MSLRRRNGGPRVWADDGDGFQFRGVERENVALVLQEGHAFASTFESDWPASDRVGRVGWIKLGTVE